MGKISIENITKDFGKTKILKNINLTVEDRSFTILLGPSGCGKSTLLRIIAGLEEPTSGDIVMDDENITARKPKDRNVAMVFQNYALYPNMTVSRNVEYGLKVRKVKKQERNLLVEQALAQVELSSQAAKLPSQMSGGQRQRVALARALVKRPKVYLMDEPLSNLDAKLRTQMRFELIDMHKNVSSTFLYVTHDQIEAMSMGTTIVLMNGGVIEQTGTPQEIYESPSSLFVAQFIGSPSTNIIKIQNFYIGIRPENILVSDSAENDFSIKASIRFFEHLGSETIYHLDSGLDGLTAKSPYSFEKRQGEVFVTFVKDKIMFFDEQGLAIKGDTTIYINELKKVMTQLL